MGTMRQMVAVRVERLAVTHERSKDGRYGYLVRPLTLILGWTVLVVGLVTIPLPGQGWLTTFLGVGILSLEQKWAHDLLTRGVHLYDRFFAWYHRQSLAARLLMISALIAVIWVIFVGILWTAWQAGALEFLDPYAAEIGLSR